MNPPSFSLALVLLIGLCLFNSPAGNAQNRSDSATASTLKQEMIDLYKEMCDLIERIETVEDVEKIDGDISQMFDDLVESLKQGVDDPTIFRTTQNDPEVQQWGSKVEQKVSQLKREHPAAAAKFEEILLKHSMKFANLLQDLMANAIQDADVFGENEQVKDYGRSDGTASVDTNDLSPALRSVRNATINLSREMYNLMEGVEAVEDIRKIDGEIGRIFDQLAESLIGVIDDPAAMQVVQTTIRNDPEVREWSQKLDRRMSDLKAAHPGVAAQFDEVINRHSEKVLKLLEKAMIKGMQERDAE